MKQNIEKLVCLYNRGQIQLQIKAYEEHVNAILVYFETPIRENDLVNQNIDTLYDKVI